MDKWMAIGLLGLAGFMFSPVIVTEYTRGQCKIAAINAHVEPEKIKELCK